MSDLYSAMKGVRHLDVIKDIREGRPARPVHVQVILSDLCNQSCHFCSYRNPDYSSSQLFYEIKPQGAGLRRDLDHPERNYNPNRMMSFDKATELIQDCATLGVQAVQFTGGGEPTVHPDFETIVRNTQNLGMKTALVTNGVIAGKMLASGNRDWKETLYELSWIRISIDAGTPETYSKIRGVPREHYERAFETVARLQGRGPIVGVGFVVTPENWSEVVLATEAAKKAGADNIRISAQFSTENEKLFAEFHNECARLCLEAESYSDSQTGFQVYNRFGEKVSDLIQQAPDYPSCGYQQFTTYVGADLNVYRCCVLAYNERGIVGSIKNQSFYDLWMKQERYDEMIAFDARGCERCQFNKINKVLDYTLRSTEPEHSEFV